MQPEHAKRTRKTSNSDDTTTMISCIICRGFQLVVIDDNSDGTPTVVDGFKCLRMLLSWTDGYM